MTSRTSPDERPSWDAWSEFGDSTWRGALIATGYLARELALHPSSTSEWDACLQRLAAIDRRLHREVEAAHNAYANEVLDFGVAVGYALAKTWPTEIEGLADWHKRALAYAGIEPDPEVKS